MSVRDDLGYDDWVEEARQERRRRRRVQACRCGSDMPGHCPGPANCPTCETEEDSDDE